MSEPNGAPPRSEDPSGHAAENVLTIQSVVVESDHGLLSACNADVGWRWIAERCPEPEWTEARVVPVSHTLGEKVRIRVSLELSRLPVDSLVLRGAADGGIEFEHALASSETTNTAVMTSSRMLPRKIMQLSLDVRWSTSNASTVSPPVTSIPVFLTLGPPPPEPRTRHREDGATPRRLAKAVEWASSVGSLDPHTIVGSLMRRFPYYALLPDPKVPAEYNHPQYFNSVGGAWPMVEHVKASGECQAIVRLVRGMLANLGVPGDVRMIVAWADPTQGGGEKPLIDDWEKNPRAGLSRRTTVSGKELVAALVDSPVVEGKTYPPSHSRLPDGTASPGLNRYEACLEFSHGGITRYYCGGAGVLASKRDLLKVFWGLVWVEFLPDDGFRVEKIVARYRSSAPAAGQPRARRDLSEGIGRLRRFWRRLTRGER